MTTKPEATHTPGPLTVRQTSVRDEMRDALACLLGYVEMRIAEGDGRAPSAHAAAARAVLAKVEGGAS
jgi:hypothetical protein